MFKIHQLDAGKLVEIQGLVSKPEKNGLVGRLIEFDSASGRWRVQIQNRDEVLCVKAENLWALTEEARPHQDQEVLENKSSILNCSSKGFNMGFELCDVAVLSNGDAGGHPPVEAFCYYDLADSGRKGGAVSLISAGREFPGDYRLTGHGLLLRGLVSIPSPIGYIEGVLLFEERSKQFVAVSNIHRQAILILCGADALARLEQCKKMDISAWITTGASILPVRLPLSKLGYLHDWTDIEPQRPAGYSRAAYYEDASGQYFLRIASTNIKEGERFTDDNTEALTEAHDMLKVDGGLIPFGPIPIDWSARGCAPAATRSDVMYSEDAKDLKISELTKKLEKNLGLLEESLRYLDQLRKNNLAAPAPQTSTESPDRRAVPTSGRAGQSAGNTTQSKVVVVAEAAADAAAAQELFDRGVRLEVGTAADKSKALELFRRAAAAGHPAALSRVGRALLTGLGGAARDVEEGVRVTRRAAELGDAMGQYLLGTCYLQGLMGGGGGGGRPGEISAAAEAEAADWYRRAVAQGDAMAQYHFGVFLLEGYGGLRRDEAAAADLIRKSAEQGEGGGHFHLGRLYETGRGGLTRSPERALYHYTTAADLGFEPALRAVRAGGRAEC